MHDNMNVKIIFLIISAPNLSIRVIPAVSSLYLVSTNDHVACEEPSKVTLIHGYVLFLHRNYELVHLPHRLEINQKINITFAFIGPCRW